MTRTGRMSKVEEATREEEAEEGILVEMVMVNEL
jgi:hypothetical protein